MPAEPQVLVIDDPSLFAESLCTALQLDDFDAERLDADDAIDRVGRTPRRLGESPAIAVLDLELASRWDPLDLITTFSALGARVLVVTATDEQPMWSDCLARGAVQVVAKSAPLAEILAVVRQLREGRAVLDPAERLDLLAERHRRSQLRRELIDRFSQLTHVEHWVLEHLVAGRGVHEIAKAGPLAPVEVRAHVRSIVDKLQVNSWLEAVVLATDPGWRTFDDVI